MQNLMKSIKVLMQMSQEFHHEVANLAIEEEVQEIHDVDSEKDDDTSKLKNFAGFNIIDMRRDHVEDTPKEISETIPEISQQTNQNENCVTCEELLETKSNMETQLTEHAKQIFETMQTLAEKNQENERLKEEMKLLKQEVENKKKEVESQREQLEEQAKSDSAKAEDINITRLRKAYISLEKEKKKQEDLSRKKIGN